MPKRETRFPLSAIEKAITAAGVTVELGERILRELQKTRPKRGKREEPDYEAVSKVLDLIPDGQEDNPRAIGAAAGRVAQDYPEPVRKAARKRFARKARKALKEAQEEIDAAAKLAARRGPSGSGAPPRSGVPPP